MEETLRDLAAERDRLQKISVAYFAVMVIAILLIFIGPALIGMLLGAALLAFYFGWLRGRIGSYSDNVGKANILNGLAEPLQDPVYLGNTGMTAEELDASAMLPIRTDDNGLLIRHGFEGKKDGGVRRGWEVTFHYQRGAKRTDYAFLSGSILTGSFDHEISGMPEWVAVQRDLVDENILLKFFREKGYRPVRTENAEPDGKYLMGVRGDGVLPEKICAKLADLGGRMERLGAVRCTAAEAAVFLDHRFYTYPIKVRDLPTEEQLRANPLPERDEIWDFFRFLQNRNEEEESLPPETEGNGATE